ncbi:unnamed protein product [Hermetia illucens]|uniref:Uncharacterized protein n=1 Tax=Hermetia illucens TaxID=343691 RepID=A0A7R8V6X5_HERIL|nr:unnamed protein product [Hermetia illucens]
MSAVKRWIRGSTSSSSSSSNAPSQVLGRQRGRSHSLDVQALERSGVRMILQNQRAAAHQQQLAAQSEYHFILVRRKIQISRSPANVPK